MLPHAATKPGPLHPLDRPHWTTAGQPGHRLGLAELNVMRHGGHTLVRVRQRSEACRVPFECHTEPRQDELPLDAMTTDGLFTAAALPVRPHPGESQRLA